MERFAIIYFEGNDSKVSLFEKDKSDIRLVRADSITSSLAMTEKPVGSVFMDDKPQAEVLNFETVSEETVISNSYVQSLNKFFQEDDLRNVTFIPVITEPAVYIQKIEDDKELSNLNISSNGKLKKSAGSIVPTAGKAGLSVFPSGKGNYLDVLSSLAKLNGLKYLKIPTVKCAEISLAEYAANKEDLKENETSLILYVGKEYSKIIFMKGKKILHLGNIVSAGKNSSNPYYIIISKILMEMENASIQSLDRIIICGEDNSETLTTALGNAYPESRISIVNIPEYTVPGKNPYKYGISTYSVNIAVFDEFMRETDKRYKGINLLPKEMIEGQKSFGWQGYLLLALIFITVFAFTRTIVMNSQHIEKANREIVRLEAIRAANQEISDKIDQQKRKIANFSKSNEVLSSYARVSGNVSNSLRQLSNYADYKRDIWLTEMKIDPARELKFSGYSLNRGVLTQLSGTYSSALLSSISYEPLREFKAYKFSINTSLDDIWSEKK